ncbi:hypothetical protein MRX96_008572 [Rhipicephalus microplus]
MLWVPTTLKIIVTYSAAYLHAVSEIPSVENEAYAMCSQKESQKGPSSSIQDVKTSLNEWSQKLRMPPTYEQGTDTEQEEHNKTFASASQRYQRLLKPHLGLLEGRLERCQGGVKKANGERQAALRDIRQLERRITEKTKQAEEERKLGREFQEGKDKINDHIKKLEAHLYDAKLECSLERSRRMDIERQVSEALVEQARLKRELAGRSELGSPWSVTGASNGDKHGACPLSSGALRSALR